MTKLKYIILLASIQVFNIQAQDVYIPDSNFKSYLLGNTFINTNSDTEIQLSEAQSYTGVLNCSSKSIANLTGIEAFTSVTVLNCRYNDLSTIDLSANINLVELNCSYNQMTSLNLTANTNLVNLDCGANLLKALDVSNNPLINLNLSQNLISTIDVSSNTSLNFLSIGFNQLTSLDVTNNSALSHLKCGNNQLSNLDVTHNTSLISLQCFRNQLTSLNLSNNTALQYLGCWNNQLSSLNLSTNNSLSELFCGGNKLTKLDLSSNPMLRFRCEDNKLLSLNIANGNNMYLDSEVFNATNNPNLTCIQVDNVEYSSANWTNIDSIAVFSEECIIENNSKVTEFDFTLAPNPATDFFIVHSDLETVEGSIVDLTGKLVENFRDKMHSVKHLKPGVYYVSMKVFNKVVVKRLIIV